MKADPTITPSAYAATPLACSRVDTPNPTATGKEVVLRTRATKSAAPVETEVRAPVTPMTLATYTKPLHFAVT